jgi:thiosulfate dehydrogenase [quinone] large subunit
MLSQKKFTLFLLRVSLGWLYFYSGITKVLDPAWSAEGFLKSAKTFSVFYTWLASPELLPLTNFVNKWALLFLGISLLLGVFVRLSSVLGVALMFLYYLPILTFPYIGKNYFLIDEHVIFSIALLVLASAQAGKTWGLESWRLKMLKFPGKDARNV